MDLKLTDDLIETSKLGSSPLGFDPVTKPPSKLLERFVGIDLNSVTNLVKNLTDGTPPKRLERFRDKDFNLTDKAVKKVGKLRVYCFLKYSW